MGNISRGDGAKPSDSGTATKTTSENKQARKPLETDERSSAPVETAGAQVAAVTLANLTGLLRTADDAVAPQAAPDEGAAAGAMDEADARPGPEGAAETLAATGEAPPLDAAPQDASSDDPSDEVLIAAGPGAAPADAEPPAAAMATSSGAPGGAEPIVGPRAPISAEGAPADDGDAEPDPMPDMDEPAQPSDVADEESSDPDAPEDEPTSDEDPVSDDDPVSDAEPDPAPQPEPEPEPEADPDPVVADPPRLTGAIDDYDIEISEDRTSVRFSDTRPGAPDGVVEADVGASLILGDATLILRAPGAAGGDLTPGGEAELLIGDDGATLRFDGETSGVDVDLSASDPMGGGAAGDIQAGFRNFVGSGGEDVVQGADAGGAIAGGAGGDQLFGGLGADTLDGGAGDDLVVGGGDQDLAVYAGDLADFTIAWDPAAETFSIRDRNVADGLDEGLDQVSDVETFSFNGVEVTADELRAEAARQANAAPGDPAAALSGPVAEDAAAGHVVATLAAADPDGDAVTYVLTDAAGAPLAGGPFEIVGDEIRVAPGAALDFETTTSHTLHVVAADALETSAPVEITVSVGDAAEVISLADGGASFVEAGVTETAVIGGDGADAITGLDGDDDLQGREGDDSLVGGDGDDTLAGGAGDDALKGGDGTDRAIFDGELADYSVTESGGVYTVTDLRPGGSSGADTVEGVEIFEFADQTIPAANILNTAPTDIETSGVSAIALNTDGGNNAYLKVTDAGDILGGSSEITVEIQFSSTGIGDGGVSPLASYYDNGRDEFLIVARDTGAGAELRIEVGSTGVVLPGYDASGLFDGRQHQVSVSYDGDGGVWRVYVDGEDVGGGAGLRPGHVITSGGELVLGQEQDAADGGFSTDQVFEGAIHDVRIFNDVRTAEEIRDAALTTIDPTEDGLAANWTMDALVDGKVADVVGGRDLAVANVDGPGWVDSAPAEVIATPGGVADGAVVTQVTGVDADAGDALVYALADDAGGRFFIDQDTGVVSVADGDLLAAEAGVTHEIIVRVGDGRGGEHEEAIAIAVDDLLIGGRSDDAIVAADPASRIVGGDGDDTLTGGAGDDEIRGGDGSDTAVYSGALADMRVEYDAGADRFTLTDLNAVDGGDEGADRVTGVETFQFSDATLTAAELQTEAARQANTAPGAPTVASGGAVIENSAAGTVVATLTAPDVDGDAITFMLTDGAGAPIVDGDFEVVGDEIRVKSGADLDFEAAQSHVLHVTASDGFTTSGPTAITVTVDDAAEVIALADGGDGFTEAATTEIMVDGGDGADVITGGAGDDRFDGNGGDDSLTGGDGADQLFGDAGNDSIHGGSGDDVLEGGGGNDSVQGFLGNDTVDGGTGNDTLQGHSGNDVVYGDQGEDQVFGGGGDDTLFGGVQDDFLGGDFGDDEVYGGDGHDLMFYEGALKDFTIAYDAATETFTITDNNAADGLDEGVDTVTGVEEFRFDGVNYSADELRAVAHYEETIGDHGVVGRWSFDGTSGVAVDKSALGNDGVLHGDTTQGAAGPFAGAGAISLDGDGDYVEIANDSAYDLSEGTISIWIQPNVIDGAQTFLSRESRQHNDGDLQMTVTSSGSISVRHQADGDSETLFTKSGVASAGEWTHVTYTWGPDGMQIAVDGQTVALNAVPRSLANDDEPFTVGADQWKSSDGATDNLERFFDGQISEFVLLSDRLESEEIADLYFGVQPADDGAAIEALGSATALFGDVGDDSIEGANGDDTLKGRGGDDTLNGDQGDDVAVYDGDLSDFAITYSGSTFMVTDLNAADGDEGTDTVTRVESFEFNGVAYTDDELELEADRQANAAPDAPTVASGGDVDENSAAGEVVATLTATDADGDALTYTLTDALGNVVTSDDFEIVDDEIRVKAGADLDFETAESHVIHVAASDAFETSSPTAITVTINDVAETIVLDSAGVTYVEKGVAEVKVRGDGGGADSLVGGEGDDVFDGWGGSDTLDGGGGDDRLHGGDHGDLIYGGEGDDLISGLWGDDTIDGGAGNDIFTTRGVLSDFEVTYDAGAEAFTLTDLSADHDGFMGVDVVTNVERFFFNGLSRTYTAQELRQAAEDQPDRDDLGAAGDQTLTGDGSVNTFYGGAGDDSLNGQGGDDTLFGGSGADTINAGLDEDLVFGGSGADTVFGGQQADTIHGDGGDDSLVGGEGDDYLAGGSGADTIEGGDGDDLLVGGTGDDVMKGGDGSDTFSVGEIEGSDLVDGGLGAAWTDVIDLQDVGPALSATGSTATGDGWTLTLDLGHTVTSLGADQLDLSDDAAGTILFDDGGRIDFQGVEAVTW